MSTLSDAEGETRAKLEQPPLRVSRASLRDAIDQDGEVIQTKAGLRDHPALKHELANRAFVVRSLARLGLDLEPVRPSAGRPPGQ